MAWVPKGVTPTGGFREYWDSDHFIETHFIKTMSNEERESWEHFYEQELEKEENKEYKKLCRDIRPR